MIHEWGVPFTLLTPYGTLLINQVDGLGNAVFPRYMLVPADCSAGWQSRVVRNDVPGGDGSILGKGFASGVETVLAIEPWEEEDQPACDELLTDMMDELRGHVWATLKDVNGASRLMWTPTGKPVRMVDDVQLGPIEPQKIIDNVRTRLTFTLDSPFPYTMLLTQTEEVIDTTSAVITMTGTAWFMPVLKVYGPFTTFAITHDDLDVTIQYDDARPGAPTIGGGDYLEIDSFRNTAFKNGNGADGMPGINLTTSDFFPLLPGANNITTDVEAHFLVNQAYA